MMSRAVQTPGLMFWQEDGERSGDAAVDAEITRRFGQVSLLRHREMVQPCCITMWRSVTARLSMAVRTATMPGDLVSGEGPVRWRCRQGETREGGCSAFCFAADDGPRFPRAVQRPAGSRTLEMTVVTRQGAPPAAPGCGGGGVAVSHRSVVGGANDQRVAGACAA